MSTTRRHNVNLSALASGNEDAASLEQRELCSLLTEELHCLPARYRSALIACYLLGKTHAEAARELNRPLGSMSRHLARGCEMLRARLARRGVCLSTGVFAALLADEATAAVTSSLVLPTVTTALAFAAGVASSGPACVLAQEVLQGMVMSKVKAVAAAFLMVGVLTCGAAGLAHTTRTQPPLEVKPQGKAAVPPRPAAEQPARLDRHGDPLPPGAIARLGTLRFRHDGEAGAMVFSLDGKVLASASGGAVILWDATTGKVLHRLSAQYAGRNSLDFTSDGKTLAVLEAGRSKITVNKSSVSLWDSATGQKTRTIEVDAKSVMDGGLRFSPDGKLLAVVTDDDKVSLLDVSSGKRFHEIGGHRAQITSLAFSPDSRTLALGTLNPAVQLWDVATGMLVRGIDSPSKGFVHSVAFAPDGKTIAGGSGAHIIHWDVAKGKEIGRLGRVW
jgi:hypothetical protein